VKILTSGVTSKITITTNCGTGTVTITPPSTVGISGSFCANGTGSGISIGGGSITIKCSNQCPGTCLYYVKPATASGPSKCNPFGWYGDTIVSTVGVAGVNITALITGSPAICGKSNGSASVTGTGGTAPYSYNW